MKKIGVLLALLIGCCLCLQVKGQERQLKHSLLGKKFPKFEVQEWLGKAPDVKGKFVLVDFWCIMAYPVMHRTVPYQNELARKYKDTLCVVGLTADEPYIVSLMVEPDIQYYNGFVSVDVIENVIGIEGWPTTYLINPEGVVVWEGHMLKSVEGDKNVFNLTESMLKKFLTE